MAERIKTLLVEDGTLWLLPLLLQHAAAVVAVVVVVQLICEKQKRYKLGRYPAHNLIYSTQHLSPHITII